MEKLQFGFMHMNMIAIVYVAYLCWVLFGGLKNRKIKVITYAIMTALMVYGIIREFNGINGLPETINIFVILVIAFTKGIVLGKHKIVEKIDNVWYMHHEVKYIIIWLVFFAIKIGATETIKFITKAEFPIWHMLLYFCTYYVCRIVYVFNKNPEMRKEVLSGYKK